MYAHDEVYDPSEEILGSAVLKVTKQNRNFLEKRKRPFESTTSLVARREGPPKKRKKEAQKEDNILKSSPKQTKTSENVSWETLANASDSEDTESDSDWCEHAGSHQQRQQIRHLLSRLSPEEHKSFLEDALIENDDLHKQVRLHIYKTKGGRVTRGINKSGLTDEEIFKFMDENPLKRRINCLRKSLRIGYKRARRIVDMYIPRDKGA